MESTRRPHGMPPTESSFLRFFDEISGNRVHLHFSSWGPFLSCQLRNVEKLFRKMFSIFAKNVVDCYRDIGLTYPNPNKWNPAHAHGLCLLQLKMFMLNWALGAFNISRIDNNKQDIFLCFSRLFGPRNIFKMMERITFYRS